MENNEVTIISSTDVDVYEAQERAFIDSQVATAKRYPRNLLKVKERAIAIVCMSKETALSCRYAKPVGGKNISGKSVHLARIICQQYGNIKVMQRIKQITETTIIAEAVAFDMETNYAVNVEARRSIIDKTGTRYKESVIETNAMALMAIAERNAILKVVPQSITDEVYNEAFKFANGDLSDNAKLIVARDKAFEFFKKEYAATEEEVISVIGVKTKEAVTAEHIADLRGFMQALKDKEISPDELFCRKKNRESDKEPIHQNEPKVKKGEEPTKIDI